MTLTSKDEYLKASSALATGFGPTQDFTDPQRGTTVQSEDGIPTSAADLPGQVFSVDQLPNPAVAVAYGLPPVQVPAHLILDNASDAVRHVQGKDALDVLNGELRQELGDPALAFDNTVRSQESSLMHFSSQTGAGLAGGALGSDGEEAEEPFVNGIKGGDGDETSGGTDVTAPIDPEGVQKGDGDREAVSAQAGTQGKTVAEADGDTEQADSAKGQEEQRKAATSKGGKS